MWLWVTRLTLLMLQVNLVRPNGDTIRTYLNIHNHMQKLRRARARVNRYAPDTVHKSGPDSVKFAKVRPQSSMLRVCCNLRHVASLTWLVAGLCRRWRGC